MLCDGCLSDVSVVSRNPDRYNCDVVQDAGLWSAKDWRPVLGSLLVQH